MQTYGIKVRIGANASGPSGIAPLDVAMDVADETGLPLMVHIDEPPPSYGEVVSRLRKGDVLTHCFRPFPNAPMDGAGNVRPQIVAARERGVYFDVAHGMGSFSWKSARAMLGHGFRPDVISSDVHALNLDGPVHDNLRVMTKFRALGWSLAEVIEATSPAPARVLGLAEPGFGDGAARDLGYEPVMPFHEGIARTHAAFIANIERSPPSTPVAAGTMTKLASKSHIASPMVRLVLIVAVLVALALPLLWRFADPNAQ